MSDTAPTADHYSGEFYGIFVGDCLEVLRRLPDGSVDAVVTDPPYGLGFMGVAWDTFDSRKGGARTDASFDHVGGNHNPADSKDAARTAKKENAKFQAWCEAWGREVLRVLKPGGHLLAFGGTRTYHRLTCGLEDAGFEVRDCIQWLYGSGFPKSLDASKAIDKAAGVEREVVGPRLTGEGRVSYRNHDGRSIGTFELKREGPDLETAPATEGAKRFAGYGTALKPANEPILVARKPLIGTVAQNLLEHGTGAVNVDGCRVEVEGGSPAAKRRETARRTGTFPTSERPAKEAEAEGRIENRSSPETYAAPWSGELIGRWPANVVLDEEAATALDAQTGELTSGKPSGLKAGGKLNCYGAFAGGIPVTGFGDSGGASRFFYVAKARESDRRYGLPADLQSNHPTVKPIRLMRYLVRLVLPPGGGVVLDPFAGTGTTGIAAVLEGGRFLGVEREPAYARLAGSRVGAAEAERHEAAVVRDTTPGEAGREKKPRRGGKKKVAGT